MTEQSSLVYTVPTQRFGQDPIDFTVTHAGKWTVITEVCFCLEKACSFEDKYIVYGSSYSSCQEMFNYCVDSGLIE